MTKYAPVLRNRTLAILIAGQWVSQFGTYSFLLGLAWYVLSTTHSRFDLGLVGTVESLALLSAVVAGVFVDRWDRRRTMLAADAVRMVASAALTGLAFEHALPFYVLLFLVLLMEVSGAFFSPALMALFPQVVADEHLAQANGLNTSAMATAQLLGLGTSGLLIVVVGPVGIFAINTASYCASLLSLAAIRRSASRPRRTLDAKASNLWRELAAGYRAMLRYRVLILLIPVAALSNVFLMPLNVLDVAWVRQVLHQPAYVYGAFGAAQVVGIVLSGLPAASLVARFGFSRLLAVAIALEGAALIAFSQAPFVFPDISALFVLGFCIGLLNTVVTTGVQRTTPADVVGRVFGIIMTMNTALQPAAAAVAGFLASRIALATLLSAGGVGCVLLGAAVVLGGRSRGAITAVDQTYV